MSDGHAAAANAAVQQAQPGWIGAEETSLMSRETHIVGFRVGRETYGVPITSLREIVRVPEITAVPDAPDYLEGVINLRGKIVSVVDLRKRFGTCRPPNSTGAAAFWSSNTTAGSRA